MKKITLSFEVLAAIIAVTILQACATTTTTTQRAKPTLTPAGYSGSLHSVTMTGKAFYDIGHAPADHSNRRRTPKDYAVWEIHPVMALQVVQ